MIWFYIWPLGGRDFNHWSCALFFSWEPGFQGSNWTCPAIIIHLSGVKQRKLCFLRIWKPFLINQCSNLSALVWCVKDWHLFFLNLLSCSKGPKKMPWLGELLPRTTATSRWNFAFGGGSKAPRGTETRSPRGSLVPLWSHLRREDQDRWRFWVSQRVVVLNMF